MQVLAEINTKLSKNLNTFLAQEHTAYREIDLKARAIAAIGQIASEAVDLQPNQSEITPIFLKCFLT